MPGARFVGFYERDAERAQQVAAELGVEAHGSLESLLDVADALTVVVPTPAHYEVARPALERGKHLLIEKPLTATIAQADELLAIAARTGAIVQTGHVERFNRAIRAALPYVDGPRFIESDRLAPFNPRGADVAVVLDLMIHDIDLVRTLVGGSVTDVHAVGVPVLTPTVDIANARLTFASGAVANITASRVSRERMRKLRIFQPSGYLSLDLAAGHGEFFRLKGALDLAELAKGPLALEHFVERVALEAPEGEPLRLEFESFVAAIRGEGQVTVTGADGREALEVALRIVAEIERTLPSLAGAGAAALMRGGSGNGAGGGAGA
jgi:predicted dehydrogenase